MWYFRLAPCCSWSLHPNRMLMQCWLVTGYLYYKTRQPSVFIFKGGESWSTWPVNMVISQKMKTYINTPVWASNLTRLWRIKGLQELPAVVWPLSELCDSGRELIQRLCTVKSIMVIDWHKQKFTPSSTILFILTQPLHSYVQFMVGKKSIWILITSSEKLKLKRDYIQ